MVAANLAWTTLCLGGYLPGTMMVASALTGAALIVHLLSRAIGRLAPTPRAHPAGWLLLPFLVYAAANVLWVTPVGSLGWRDWFGWAEMIAIFWVVINGARSPAPRRALFVTLVTVGFATVVAGGYQHFGHRDWLMLGRVQAQQFSERSSGTFGIPNSEAAFLILLIPALGALACRRNVRAVARVFWGATALVFVFGLVLTISRGAWLGLAIALAAWPLLAGNGSWWRRLGIAGAVVGALFVVGGVLYEASPKVRERLVYLVRDRGERTRPIMWRGAWQLFREHPALGTGAGSYNVLFEKYRPEQFPDEPKWVHNDYLNTLSDYGLVGFGLFFGACGSIAWRGRRISAGRRSRREDEGDAVAVEWIDDPNLMRALGIGILAFGLHVFVDYHFKIPALAMALAVVSALVVSRLWPVEVESTVRPSATRRTAAAAVAMAVALATGAFFVIFRAEDLRFRARESIDLLAVKPPEKEMFRDRVLRAQTDLAEATVLDPWNGQAWSDLSYATTLRSLSEPGRNAEFGREAEVAADRALAVSKVYAEFWVRRGMARDMQGRWLDGGGDFTQALAVAPNSSLMWFYYADHLRRNPTQHDSAVAAVAVCLRLDPGNPEGLALRQRLAISPKGS